MQHFLAVLIGIGGVTAAAQASTKVGCGHATRVPRIDVQQFEDHHEVTLTGVGMTEFVRQLGITVDDYWQGSVKANLPLSACRYGAAGLPVAHCHQGPMTNTQFEVYTADGSHLGTKNAGLVDIDLVKTIVLHADGERQSQSLALAIDWYYPNPARLTAEYAISTCSAN